MLMIASSPDGVCQEFYANAAKVREVFKSVFLSRECPEPRTLG